MATLGEQLKGFFGWKTRTSGDGVIPILERRNAIRKLHPIAQIGAYNIDYGATKLSGGRKLSCLGWALSPSFVFSGPLWKWLSNKMLIRNVDLQLQPDGRTP